MCEKQLGTTNTGWPIYATLNFCEIFRGYRKKRKKHRFIDWSIDKLLKDLKNGQYGTDIGYTEHDGVMHKRRVRRYNAGKSYGYRAIVIVYKQTKKIIVEALFDKRKGSDLSDTMYDDIKKNF